VFSWKDLLVFWCVFFCVVVASNISPFILLLCSQVSFLHSPNANLHKFFIHSQK
jgi:hypothetical protein